MRFSAFVIAATTAFLMACGGGSPADKLMSFQDKVLSILEDNKSDLDKAAKEIKSYLESNKDSLKTTMADMQKMAEDLKGDPEKMASMMADVEKKKEAMDKRMEQLEKDVPGIKDHAGLKEAMGSMD